MLKPLLETFRRNERKQAPSNSIPFGSLDVRRNYSKQSFGSSDKEFPFVAGLPPVRS